MSKPKPMTPEQGVGFAVSLAKGDMNSPLASNRAKTVAHGLLAEHARAEALAAGWRCFHCGEWFIDQETAAAHFGVTPHFEPGCVEKLTPQQANSRRIAYEAERDAHAEYIRKLKAEEAAHVHALIALHAVELRREEENGYARGLKAAYELAAQECDRHASFCENEARNGGNWQHLMARSDEAIYNAQRIRALASPTAASAPSASQLSGAGVQSGPGNREAGPAAPAKEEEEKI